MVFDQYSIVLLIAVSVIGACVTNFVKAYYCKRAMNRESDYYLFNGSISLAIAAAVLGCSCFRITASWYSVCMGVLFGVINFVYAVIYSMAIKEGPISYTNVIVNTSTIITALSGWLIWQEPCNAWMIAGLVLMIGCMTLSNAGDTTEKKGQMKKWLLLTVASMFLCTCVGLCQKVHQTSEHKDEIYMMLLVAFAVSTVLSFVVYGIKRKRESAQEKNTAQICCGTEIADPLRSGNRFGKRCQ